MTYICLRVLDGQHLPRLCCRVARAHCSSTVSSTANACNSNAECAGIGVIQDAVELDDAEASGCGSMAYDTGKAGSAET